MRAPPFKPLQINCARPSVTPETPYREAVNAYIDYYRPGWTKSTYDCVITMLATFRRYFPAAKPVGSFRREDINSFTIYMLSERKLRGTTIRDRLSRISAFFRWLLEDEVIKMNPVQFRRIIDIPNEAPRRRPFTYPEYMKLRAYLSCGQGAARSLPFWLPAIAVAWHTGLRMIDVAHLRWFEDDDRQESYVDLVKEVVVARPVKRRKVRQELEIPMEPELHDLLVAQYAVRDKERATVLPLMTWYYDTQNQRQQMIATFRAICREAGMHTDLTFHSFRHGFVTRLINAGVEPMVIASMTGQSLNILKDYAHVHPDTKSAALERARDAIHKTHLGDLRTQFTPAKIEI